MVRKSGLPPRVYLQHGAWYYVTPARKWIRLCGVAEGLPRMYRALADLQERHSARGPLMPSVVTDWLADRAPHWATATRRNNDRIAAAIASAFAEFAPADITTVDCATYLQTLASKPRTHNQHRNILSQLLAYAAVRGLREGHNPVANIKGKSTPGRHRIVTDADIAAIKAALAHPLRRDASGRALCQMIDLALLTGQRIGDIRTMRWQDVTDAGLYVEQAKGKRGSTPVRLLIEWTPALRAAVDACAEGTNKLGHLLKTRSGGPYTYAGLRSAWVRACARAGVEDLHIHDLRGRAGVDVVESGGLEDARALLGHQTQRMTAHYTGGKRIVRVKPAR